MKVAAIIPAYNESRRIGSVLRVLAASSFISEIIVVDDGSKDSEALKREVTKYPNTIYIRNKENHGKGYSLEQGVRATKAEVLLFSDADLTNLTSDIVDKVIAPVYDGTCPMFIGIFYTPFRTLYDYILAFTGFPSGIHSGLRALKRDIWETLPNFYKAGYKIETGLNYLVLWKYGEVKYKRFPYTQVIKEQKYGLLKGGKLRLKMIYELVYSLGRALLYERWFGFGRGKRRAYEPTYR